MGNWRVLVDLGIIRKTFVPILVDTSFIDCFGQVSFRAVRKVVSYYYRPVLTLMPMLNESNVYKKDSISKASILLFDSEDVKQQKVQVIRRVKLLLLDY